MKNLVAAGWGMALLAACTPAADQPSPVAVTSRAPVTEIRVTRDSQEGPETCHPFQVGQVVSSFLRAFSEGDPSAADFFSEDMEWYSISEWSPDTKKRHFVTHDRSGLRARIESRAAAHEQVVLLEVDVQFDDGRDLGHIAYAIERTADDFAPGTPVTIGKGAIECDTGKILLLSMSHDSRFQDVPELCPGNATPPDIALACARA